MITIDTTTDARFDLAELSVCTVCIHLLANGEYDDGTDAAALCADGMANLWGDDARHLIADGEELGYSTSACEGCDDTDHGDRFAATLLRPKR